MRVLAKTSIALFIYLFVFTLVNVCVCEGFTMLLNIKLSGKVLKDNDYHFPQTLFSSAFLENHFDGIQLDMQ